MDIIVTPGEYEFLLEQLGFHWTAPKEEHTQPTEEYFWSQISFVEYVREEIGGFRS